MPARPIFWCVVFWVATVHAGSTAPVVVDPAKPLINSTVVAPAKLARPVDLDLGYNDYVDIRAKLTAGSSKGLRLRFATSATPAMDASREVEILPQSLKADGAWHTYRVDLGLQIWWRSGLTELSVEPFEGKQTWAGDRGQAEVESIVVGDLPDDEHLIDASKTAPHELLSKHFRILWGTGASAKFTEEQARGSLRNFEEAWQVLSKMLGLKPNGHRNGKQYRINVLTMNGGYWAGGGVVNIDPSGLRVDPPTWVIPHELTHNFQEAQGGHMAGHWWENHANYGRERYLRHYSNLFPGDTNFDPYFTTMAHWTLAHGRDYYLCWPIWAYVDENPDNLSGLGGNFSSRMWQQAKDEENLFNLIARLAPWVNVQDMIGLYARRSVAWDYANHAAMERGMKDFLRDPIHRRWVYPELIQRPDDPSWWRVSADRAPQQGAYTVHELVPDQSAVTVEFRGLPDRQRGADWRASLVARDEKGSIRYSDLWKTGKQQFVLKPEEKKLFLVVAATPKEFIFGSQDDMRFPWATHPQRQRFPYEVRLTGARPYAETSSPSKDRGARHPNGGGFVGERARVAASAYVGPDAQVLNEAQVSDNARIEDYAIVRDRAQVRDRAVVSGHAIVRQQAIVRDDACVRDWALVSDKAEISGLARILQRANVHSSAIVRDHATVEGFADLYNDEGKQYVGGDAVLSADYGGGRKVTNGFQFGFIPYVGCPADWIAARTAPPQRFIAYDFAAPHDSLLKDNPGITDGTLIGSPTWMKGEGAMAGSLAFDGKTQAVLLERSACDFPASTYAARVKWAGGTAHQPIFHFGTGADRCVYLTPDDGSGRPALIGRLNGKQYVLRGSRAMPTGQWVFIAASLDGKTASLWLGPQEIVTGEFPIRPRDCLGPNTGAGVDHDYLARDSGGRYFCGNIGDVKIWSAAISSAQIKSESETERGLLGRFAFDQPKNIQAIADHIRTAIPNQPQGTLAAWIYPISSRPVDIIESVIDADEPGHFGSGWGLNGGKFRVILNNEFWETNVPVKLNQWQHVALTFTAKEARLLVDGEVRATHPYHQGGVSKRRYTIGKSAANELFFHGELFDVRIYNLPIGDQRLRELAATKPPARK